MYDRKTILTAIVVSGMALGAGSATAAEQGTARPASAGATLPPEVMAAMQRDLGLTADQVRTQQALQAKATKLDATLKASLGKALVGSVFNAKTGRLVVTVSDASRVGDVQAAGADARVAKHSRAQLDATMAQLDEAAGKSKGAGPSGRGPRGARSASVAGMTSWYIDTAADVVRITVEKGKAKSAKMTLAKYGDAVAIDESSSAPREAANYMDGADVINGNCSAGFNVRSSWNGIGYLLTAGHCVAPSSTLRGQGGYVFGPTLESWYTSGYDDALVRNDSAGYWIQGPWVDVNPSNGGVITTRSWTDGPVGTSICKSGITTKWTCGYITAKNETVTYTSGYTLYGLTRHSACVEPGDSGGSNVSTSTWAAEGVTSGARLNANRCLSVYGQANVSWYHPIADSLNYYGPRYGITTWP
jgi:streptogrisin C